MKVYFDNKVRGGFFLALTILTSLGISAYRESQWSVATNEMVLRVKEALYHIERFYPAHLQIEVELMCYAISLDTIFFSFYGDAIKNLRTQEFEGAGVRLALVNQIVSRHVGKIWAEANVNKGNTFLFIPLQNLT